MKDPYTKATFYVFQQFIMRFFMKKFSDELSQFSDAAEGAMFPQRGPVPPPASPHTTPPPTLWHHPSLSSHYTKENQYIPEQPVHAFLH